MIFDLPPISKEDIDRLVEELRDLFPLSPIPVMIAMENPDPRPRRERRMK